MKRYLPYIFLIVFSLIGVGSAIAQVPIAPIDEAAAPSGCFNNIDDDGDGLIDCLDPDCNGTGNGFKFPTCNAEINCSDGIDNDGDGLIDCYDNDCKGKNNNTVCPIENNCGNGVDDDGDGFIDYYDGDCLGDPGNPNDYVVDEPGCQIKPVGNVFNLVVAWKSEDGITFAYGMPAIGDIDNDNTPEVVVAHERQHLLSILEGAFAGAGRNPATITIDVTGGRDIFAYPVIGDVDKDGDGEIFIMDKGGSIRCFDNNLNLVWGAAQNQDLPEYRSCYTDFGSFMGLADFNQDGRPELYYGNEIRDAITGQLLVKGSHGTTNYTLNNWEEELNGQAVAVDILPAKPGLELVIGSLIFSVNITNTTGTAGNSLTEELNMDDAATLPADYPTNGYRTKLSTFDQNFSSTSVVDYDKDGFLDVIMAGAGEPDGGVNLEDGPTTVYYWNIQNNYVKSYLVADPTCSGAGSGFDSKCTWTKGMGTINVADIDGDGNMNCTFASAENLYALDENFNEIWINSTTFQEGSSGFTGTSVFDFDGDGASEIIYRDENALYVVNGADGTILGDFSQPCESQTQGEYPIVADVDNDGETELICNCRGTDNTNSNITVFEATEGSYWVPARKLWNQQAYFNVNVNDNLTIPTIQQPHHLNFAQICNDPSITSSFPLNTFLNQSPQISYCGRVTYPSPKLDFNDEREVTSPVCPDNEIEVKLSFTNNGDAPVNDRIPIAFYRDNPEVAYTNLQDNPWLDTVYVSVQGGLQPGQRLDTTLTIDGARGDYTLYISLNDIGPFDKSTKNPLTNSVFYPLDTLNGTIRECDQDPTIIKAEVTSVPFKIQAQKLSDNNRCDITKDNNGSATVLTESGDPISNSDYDFAWYNVNTGNLVDTLDTPVALDSGMYYVIVTHAKYGCSSEADTVTIDLLEAMPVDEVVTIEKINDVSNCDPGVPYDGEAKILVDGSTPDVNKYDILWELEENGDDVGTGVQLGGLGPSLYKVNVTNKATGCSASPLIDMSLPIPNLLPLEATPSTHCGTDNGSIVAKIDTAGTNGAAITYDFLLKNLDTQVEITQNNGNFTGLAPGPYEVRPINTATQCGQFTEGKKIDIQDSTVSPGVTLSVLQEQTACSAPFNGQLTATPDIAGDYAYEWYRGTTTQGPTKVQVGNTQTTEDTLGIEINPLYTLVFRDNITGCDSISNIILPENMQFPDKNLANVVIDSLTTCDPNNPNGAISISMNGNTTDYTFKLYVGTTISQPDSLESTNGNFTGLRESKYAIEIITDSTRCATPLPLSAEVKDKHVDPVIDFTLKDNNTSCDDATPNGALSATADGSNSTTDYTFRWKDEDGNQYNTPSISGLAKGNYQLKVTDSNTLCNTTKVAFVDKTQMEDTDLKVTLTPKDRDFCNPFNGEIEVTEIVDTDGKTYDINDFTYTWYQVTDPGIDSVELVGEKGLGLDSLDLGLFTVMAYSNITKCLSASYSDSVRNAAVEPELTVDTEQLMSNCIDPDGKFSIYAKDENNNDITDEYAYTWYLGYGTLPQNFLQEGKTVEDARAAVYTIVATDTTTKCNTTQSFELQDLGNILPVFTTQQAVPSLSCDNRPNGKVFAVVDTLIGAGATQNDYEFYWFMGNSAPPLAGGGPGDIDFSAADHSGNGNAGRVWDNRPAGEYTIVARYAPDQCQSIPKTVKVVNIAKPPVLTEISNMGNTLCSTPGNGALEIQASKAPMNGNYPGDTTKNDGYEFNWTNIGVATGIRNNLNDGKYIVTVTDLNNQCVTQDTFRIEDETLPPSILDFMVIHQTTCIEPPVGSIEVTDMMAGPAMITSAQIANDYNFHWYTDENVDNSNLPANRVALGTAGVADNNLLTGQSPGVYYALAENAVTGCLSFPTEEEILNNRPDLDIYLDTAIPDFLTCTGTNEGFIEVSIDGTTTDPYTINWYTGADTTNNITGTASISNTVTTSLINNLQDGRYTVVVQDTGPGSSQCKDSASFTIKRKTVKPNLMVSKISDQTLCTPNGSIRIDQVTLGGNAENLNDYQFTWYQSTLDNTGKDDFMNAGYAFTNTDSLEAAALTGNAYFVTAVKINPTGLTDCNAEYQIDIKDKSEPIQVVLADISDPITGCNPAIIAEGELEIEVRNSNNYTTQWFAGNTADPANALPAFDNALDIDGLIPGFYTVAIDDAATGCNATRNYEIASFVVPIAVVTSSSPYTSCIAPNGSVAANASGGSGQYTYTWYEGANPSGTPLINASNQSLLEGLINGTFTVLVQDRNEAACEAIAEEVVVEDGRGKQISIAVTPEFSVTNCDEERPNGQLSASIAGEMSRFNFFWYEGATTANKPIAFGPVLSNIPAQTYTVIARDKLTGCLSGQFSATVEEGEKSEVPDVFASVIAQQTHCTLPVGAALAYLDSTQIENDVDYIYTWYRGDKGQGNPIFFSDRTSRIVGLDQGAYSVMVTNALTGCTAGPASVQIDEQLTYPDFEVATTPATCNDDNGSAEIVFTEPITIRQISWNTPIGFADGFTLEQYPAGLYEVTIIDQNGCMATRSAEIGTDIKIFNGLSPNGDGKNEIFTISCIDSFRDNIVKIYNRAGALVFESTNYSNDINYFDGRGNRGLYIGGKDLPDGTYYYIVDKKDGVKPASGYLELLR